MDPVAGLVAVLTLTPMAASVNPGAAISLGQNPEIHAQDLRAQELTERKTALLRKRARLQKRDTKRYSARLQRHIADKIASLERQIAEIDAELNGSIALR